MPDPVPPKQGVVTAQIQPIQAKDVLKNLGKADAVARGVALYLPQFAKPPQLQPGTEARDDNGDPILGTGVPVPESVEVVPLTLEKARDAALRVLKHASQMPINELSVDLLNLAYALLHYENKARGGTP